MLEDASFERAANGSSGRILEGSAAERQGAAITGRAVGKYSFDPLPTAYCWPDEMFERQESNSLRTRLFNLWAKRRGVGCDNEAKDE